METPLYLCPNDEKKYPITLKQIGFLIALVACADFLFYDLSHIGWVFGLYFMILLSVSLPLNVEFLRKKRVKIGLSILGLVTLGLIWNPGWWACFLAILSVIGLRMIVHRGNTSSLKQWIMRGTAGFLSMMLEPCYSLCSLFFQRKETREAGGFKKILLIWGIPAILGVTFICLFSAGNPIFHQYLGKLGECFTFDLRDLRDHIFFWILIGWIILGMRLAFWQMIYPEKGWQIPGTLGSDRAWIPPMLTRALILFNLIFLVQNSLDIEYLWAGAALPAGMTYAEYAHQAAYPLILTVLLAAAFILIGFAKSHRTPEWKWARIGVIVWLAQNVFLVFSAILRLVKYVHIYDLTEMRVCAFIWYGVILIGLGLTAWFILHQKSSSWLINANLAVAIGALFIGSVSDVAGFVANYNVESIIIKVRTWQASTSETRNSCLQGRNFRLDDEIGEVIYLWEPALPALEKLYMTPRIPCRPDTRQWLERAIMDARMRLDRDLSDWRSWTGCKAYTRMSIQTDTSFLPDTVRVERLYSR